MDGVLAFLDVPLRCAPLNVEGHYPPGGAAQVGEDEAVSGMQFAGMPFHLGPPRVVSHSSSRPDS